MQKTLIFIHGAESFIHEEEYQDFLKNVFVPRYTEPWKDTTKPDWKLPIARAWSQQGGVVYYPTMPNKQNARYTDWKVVFEGILEKLSPEDEITLIGGSLGGCFLLKYFSNQKEQNPPVSPPTRGSLAPLEDLLRGVRAVHLIAACISEGDFTAPTSYEILQSLGSKVHIWHAEDDPVVPFEIAKELERILPQAQTHFFPSEKGYGHFHGIENIPELEKMLI